MPEVPFFLAKEVICIKQILLQILKPIKESDLLPHDLKIKHLNQIILFLESYP